MALLAIERIGEYSVKGTFRSDITGKITEHLLKITRAEMDEWLQCQRVAVFKFLSDQEKELFITGMSDAEWKEVFGPEE